MQICGVAQSCVRKANAPRFSALCEIGLRDTLRIHHKEGELFSWWDYQMRAFERNRGLRIDAILAGEKLAKRCSASGIDTEMRKGKEPSDHAPVWAEFDSVKIARSQTPNSQHQTSDFSLDLRSIERWLMTNLNAPPRFESTAKASHDLGW